MWRARGPFLLVVLTSPGRISTRFSSTRMMMCFSRWLLSTSRRPLLSLLVFLGRSVARLRGV
jgi:hypothetical protein